MGDSEGAVPPSKKRVAGRQITQLDPEPDEDAPEPEMGNFQRASEEVLATRRIVKVRRLPPPSAPSSNPFAGICLVPPTDPSAKVTITSAEPQNLVDKKRDAEHDDDEKTGEEKGVQSCTSVNEPNGTDDKSELEDVTDASKDDKVRSDGAEEATPSVVASDEVDNGRKKTEKEAIETEDTGRREKVTEDNGRSEKVAGEEKAKVVRETAGEETDDGKSTADPAAPVSSFQQLSSSQNAFTGLSGTGFSSSSFSFGSYAKDGSTFTTGSLFGFKNDGVTFPSFGIASSNNGSSSFPLSGSAASGATKNGGTISMPLKQDVPIETGEENEKAVFSSDAVLYEYLDGGWKERGKGELKVNVSISDSEKARLVMRSRGNYRLILNASLYPDMLLTDMEKKGVTFACVNSVGEGKSGLTTFALKFRDSTFVEEFRGVVAAHKGKLATVLKTPDSSPKASDDQIKV